MLQATIELIMQVEFFKNGITICFVTQWNPGHVVVSTNWIKFFDEVDKNLIAKMEVQKMIHILGNRLKIFFFIL